MAGLRSCPSFACVQVLRRSRFWIFFFFLSKTARSFFSRQWCFPLLSDTVLLLLLLLLAQLLLLAAVAFADVFFQGGPRERFLSRKTFHAGLSHHGNSRNVLYGSRPQREPFPRELAITRIHVFFCTGTGHNGKSSRNRAPRQRFPRELTTAEFTACFSQKAPTMGFHRT